MTSSMAQKDELCNLYDVLTCYNMAQFCSSDHKNQFRPSIKKPCKTSDLQNLVSAKSFTAIQIIYKEMNSNLQAILQYLPLQKLQRQLLYILESNTDHVISGWQELIRDEKLNKRIIEGTRRDN